MVIGNFIAAKIQHGVQRITGDLAKEANLLAGDAMTNYKTIQSMGNNEVVIKMYEDLMRPVYESTTQSHIKTSIAFGLGNFG
jgi:ABC-type transport system involved in Fe-S cluster assembly fused permease/ATPase subunit